MAEGEAIYDCFVGTKYAFVLLVNVFNLNRPVNCHGSAVSLTIFCHFSQSHDKAPNLTGFWEKIFLK